MRYAAAADIHREQPERAEHLAELARRRIPGANAAAERQERLGEAADAHHGEVHVRAAALQRDAQAIFERAVALHVADARDRATDKRDAVVGARDDDSQTRSTASPPPTAVLPPAVAPTGRAPARPTRASSSSCSERRRKLAARRRGPPASRRPSSASRPARTAARRPTANDPDADYAPRAFRHVEETP